MSEAFATSARLLLEEFTHLNTKRLSQVPQGHDRRIAFAFFESAYVSPINAHAFGKPSLGDFRPKPQSPHVSTNKFSRVLSH